MRWKRIVGYEELYSISESGEVLAHVSNEIKCQSGGHSKSRYKYVTLYKDNVGTKLTVHRIVAKHFVKNPKGHPYVLHKNDDRSNNRASNLKWGTQKHNHNDSVRNGTAKLPPIMIGVDQPRAKLTPDKVRQIRAIRDGGLRFTQVGLAKKFAISRGTLRSILKNKHWRHVL